MIAKANIILWKTEAPWQMDTQVEQDLILSRMIVEIFSNPVLKELVAFKGGTALTKLFVPGMRYSEDIDLVQIQKDPDGTGLDEIEQQIRKLFDTRWPDSNENYRGSDSADSSIIRKMKYTYRSSDAPPKKIRIKMDIAHQEPFTTMGWEYKSYKMENPWFKGECTVRTYNINELLGRKLSAVESRSRGRDLFDLWQIIKVENLHGLDMDKIIECAQDYRNRMKETHNKLADQFVGDEQKLESIKILDVQPLTKDALNIALDRNLADNFFCEDVNRQLKTKDKWDALEAGTWFRQTFLPKF